MSEPALIALVTAGAYLCGSVSCARLCARAAAGVDITSVGTGNPGAANVWRSVGRVWGLLTWLGDMVKVLLPMAVGKLCGLSSPVLLAVVGCCGVVGHAFPVWHRFKGGKGAASLGGVLLFLLPAVFPLVVVLWFVAQRVNPRSKPLLLAATAVYFLALAACYAERFSVAASVSGILIGTGIAVNFPIFLGKKSR